VPDDYDNEGEDRRPFSEEPDDLFVWNDLRPPQRPAGAEPRRAAAPPPNAYEDATRAYGAPPPGGERRPADGRVRPRRSQYGSDDEWQEWLDPGEGAQAGEPAAGDGPGGPFGPDALGHVPGRGRPRRRRVSAGAVLAAMLLGFFVAGLLDAAAIQKRVQGEELGAMRSLQLALLKPVVAVSGLLQLDRPAEALNAALGRGEEVHHTIAETKQKQPKWPREITAAKPLRLWIIGDSMGQVFGSSLKNLAEDTGLIKAKMEYKVSSGLSRPDFYDWPQHMIDQIVDWNPDATTVLFGANDGQNFYSHGKVLNVGTKAWKAEYAKRVGKAMTILTRGGRRVYWVGQPIMRNSVYRDKTAMIDKIYAAEAKKHPGVQYISTWVLFADKKGSYTEALPGSGGELVVMRAPDGIHLTRAGGDRMAQVVLDVIEKDWGIPQQP
jgi:hypothetical protein